MSQFVRNEYNTRIKNITKVRTAKITYKGYCFGLIAEERNDKNEWDWVIYPNYDEIARICPNMPIRGIDIDMHLPEYVRTILPSFVLHRTLPDCREDLPEYLERLGMTEYDKFEFMVRSKGYCGGDPLLVERLPNDYYDYSKGIFGHPLSDDTRYALRNIISKKG